MSRQVTAVALTRRKIHKAGGTGHLRILTYLLPND